MLDPKRSEGLCNPPALRNSKDYKLNFYLLLRLVKGEKVFKLINE